MVPSSVGAVVMVSFPLSDLSQTKLRPAVVLAGAGRPRRYPGPHCQPPLPPDARNEGTLRAGASNFMVVAQMRLIGRPRFDEYEPPRWVSPAGNRASKCEALFWPPDAIDPLPRIFINTEIKVLAKHKELFHCHPVAAAGVHERKQMVDILPKLSAPSLEPNPIIVANSFANKRRSELRDRERQKRIQHLLRAVLTNPRAEVFTALSALDCIWEGIEPKASDSKLNMAWLIIQEGNILTKAKSKPANLSKGCSA